VRVKILGSAAGGGFPQWNCACRNCSGVLSGAVRSKRRSQTQVAVSHTGNSWCLLNASPDLRSQILNSPELQPRQGEGTRDSPIASVAITGADVDQVAGLLHLREFQPLQIYATESVRRILTDGNSIFRALQQVPNQAAWRDLPANRKFQLACGDAPSDGFRCESFSIAGDFPAYASGTAGSSASAPGKSEEAVLGLILESASEKKLAYMPNVAKLEDAWLPRLDACDILLFDGTFWDDDELIRIRGEGKSAREMGHIPISGAEASLERFSKLTHPRKIFIHVNNTNPILDEDSRERQQVAAAGWEIAEDGWDLEL
jgi:pyrroloquinoline quinone biosynthesis protein B